MAIHREIKTMQFLKIEHNLNIPCFILENKELTPAEKIFIAKILDDFYRNPDDINPFREYEKAQFEDELGFTSLKEINVIIKKLKEKKVLIDVKETRDSISFYIGKTEYTVKD